MPADQTTPGWLDAPITRRDVIVGIACWSVLEGIKAAFGLGSALLVAGGGGATLVLLLWMTAARTEG